MERKTRKPGGIAKWPEEERPRERLLGRGPGAVSDAELVAILIRTGVKGINAVEMGRRLLQRFGSLADLVRVPVSALLEEQGLKGANALYLNRVHGLIDDALIAHGDVGSVRPSVRTIMTRALQANASGLIVAHNHPSGMADASEADRLLTKDILSAARALQLRVLDHVIVADDSVFSFSDSGLLDELAIEAGVV